MAAALETSARAWPAWREQTAKARGEILQRIATHVEQRANEIARMITAENGKPLAQSEAEVVEGVAIAKFRNSGQSCIAANRIYVQRGLYDRFVDAFVGRTRALKVGNGLEPQVDIGPLVDKAALDKAAAHVADAVARGARLHCGGEIVRGRPGFFFAPAVLTDVPDDALCQAEETFAPGHVSLRL